jgi:hypothetical protein
MNRKHLTQFVAIVGAVMLLYVASIGPATAIAINRANNYSDLEERGTALAKFYAPLKHLTGKTGRLDDLVSAWVRAWKRIIPQKEMSPFRFGKDADGEIDSAAANNDDISTRELKGVTANKNLMYLGLGEAPEGVDLEEGALSVLASCQRLEDFRLSKTHLCDADLEVLPKLKTLKWLWIEGNDLVGDSSNRTPGSSTNGLTDKSMETLGILERLEELVIRGEGDFSDDFARKLSALPRLTRLEISSQRFSDRALEAIAAHPRLQSLRISSPRFTDNGVQALARMPALESLEIDSPLLTKQSLHAIAPLAGLKTLYLPIKEVDREALAVVAGWKAMESLILRRAEIGDDQFEALRGHPSLESLFLESATLTEKSAPVVESLRALKYGEFGRGSRIRKVNRTRH